MHSVRQISCSKH